MFFNFLTKRNNEERTHTRKIQFCSVVCKYQENSFKAFLVDVSSKGLKIKLSNNCGIPKEVDKIEMEINTPYGKTKCEGSIIWKKNNHMGVTFTKKSHDVNDPINCLINSPI